MASDLVVAGLSHRNTVGKDQDGGADAGRGESGGEAGGTTTHTCNLTLNDNFSINAVNGPNVIAVNMLCAFLLAPYIARFLMCDTASCVLHLG